MSFKTVPTNDSHCIVPVILLSILCVAASFSSLLYAISVRADIEVLTERLEALASCSGCETFELPLAVRKSEVINERVHGVESDTRDQSDAKQRVKRSPQNREFQEEDDVEDFSRSDRRPKGKKRGGSRDDATVRPGPRMTNPPQSIALHLDGDASNYTMGHRHYEGNGRVRHPEGIFRDWRLKDWANRFGRHFQMVQTVGTVNVRESGIYFVYAQVHYSDNHDVNGFRILVNDVPVLQCTVTSHGGAHLKSNTCFTGGLVELRAGDNLSVRDLAALRYSIFEAGKSFFGLFRVSHLPPVPREGLR